MSSDIEKHLTQEGLRVGPAGPAALDKQAIEGVLQVVLVLLVVVARILAGWG